MTNSHACTPYCLTELVRKRGQCVRERGTPEDLLIHINPMPPQSQQTGELFSVSLPCPHRPLAIVGFRQWRPVVQGRYEEAEPLYKRAIVIWEAAMGEDHPHVANALGNWAVSLTTQVGPWYQWLFPWRCPWVPTNAYAHGCLRCKGQ